MKVYEEKKKKQRDRLGNRSWRTHRLKYTSLPNLSDIKVSIL